VIGDAGLRNARVPLGGYIGARRAESGHFAHIYLNFFLLPEAAIRRMERDCRRIFSEWLAMFLAKQKSRL
jgi:hypothetical protein